MARTAFYAWQSDRDSETNWHFIGVALQAAIKRLNANLAIEESDIALTLDRDTHGEPGMPAVADTILRKITEASIFVGDLTFVTEFKSASRTKYQPNANVLIEMGYAAKCLGFERLVCVFNEHYGEPAHLPFDLVHRQFPICYRLAPEANADERSQALEKLTRALVRALETIVSRLGLTEEPQGLPSHAFASLDRFSFVESPSWNIARAKTRTEDGAETEYVYWYNQPCAYLRFLPAADRGFTRTTLKSLIEHASQRLPVFGDPPHSTLFPNDWGMIAVGYDDELRAEALEVTQVFRSGEIWGLNRRIVERERVKNSATYLVHWPATQTQFLSALGRYTEYAREVLQVEPAIVIVAGLALVKDALLVKDKEKWFSDPETPSRCMDNFIRFEVTITAWDQITPALLNPLFDQILDACQ
jgi:hypothetical protein